MSSLVSSVLFGLTALSCTLASPTPGSPNTNAAIINALPNRLLHYWPNGTWVENISVRSNGNLLVTTSTPDASVWEIKEPWKDEPQVERAYNFDEWADRLIGIGETTKDKFVVVGSRFYSPDAQSSQVERTFGAFELDYSGNKVKPTARLVAWFPDASLLQGVAALPWDRTKVLISDQYVAKPRASQIDWTPAPGQIWVLDTVTGAHEVVLTNRKELNTTYHHGHDVGINGVKFRRDYLYWVNQDDGYIYRIKIGKDGHPVAPAKIEIVAFEETIWDDFTFGPRHDEIIWATGLNAIFAVSSKGNVVLTNGIGTTDNGTFPGPTSCAFGRNAKDNNVLYVTGNLYDVPTDLENVHLRGWVRAVDTTGFKF